LLFRFAISGVSARNSFITVHCRVVSSVVSV
jgi:hypothetical protein